MSKKIKLPRHMIFHHDLRLMVFRPRGILTEKHVDKDVAMLEAAEDQAKEPFNRFSDLSQLKRIKLDFQYVFRIALHRRLKYAKRPPVRSAFYVTSEEAARVIRVHALVTDYSPLRVQMFEKIEDAAEWLGVSVDDLKMGS
jgi:hypothetical protein